MVSPGNQKNNMTKTQPTGIHASTPWFINFLTSRCAHTAEIIGIPQITKTIADIPTIKKVGDVAESKGIKKAEEKAMTTIKPITIICAISNPRKNNTFFIILMIKNFLSPKIQNMVRADVLCCNYTLCANLFRAETERMNQPRHRLAEPRRTPKKNVLSFLEEIGRAQIRKARNIFLWCSALQVFGQCGGLQCGRSFGKTIFWGGKDLPKLRLICF